MKTGHVSPRIWEINLIVRRRDKEDANNAELLCLAENVLGASIARNEDLLYPGIPCVCKKDFEF